MVNNLKKHSIIQVNNLLKHINHFYKIKELYLISKVEIVVIFYIKILKIYN
jgi:hypothetical protein